MDNVAVFNHAHPPLLIVHGQKDNMLSVQNAIDLFHSSISTKDLLILPDGDHGSFGKGNAYFKKMHQFLAENNL